MLRLPNCLMSLFAVPKTPLSPGSVSAKVSPKGVVTGVPIDSVTLSAPTLPSEPPAGFKMPGIFTQRFDASTSIPIESESFRREITGLYDKKSDFLHTRPPGDIDIEFDPDSATSVKDLVLKTIHEWEEAFSLIDVPDTTKKQALLDFVSYAFDHNANLSGLMRDAVWWRGGVFSDSLSSYLFNITRMVRSFTSVFKDIPGEALLNATIAMGQVVMIDAERGKYGGQHEKSKLLRHWHEIVAIWKKSGMSAADFFVLIGADQPLRDKSEWDNFYLNITNFAELLQAMRASRSGAYSKDPGVIFQAAALCQRSKITAALVSVLFTDDQQLSRGNPIEDNGSVLNCTLFPNVTGDLEPILQWAQRSAEMPLVRGVYHGQIKTKKPVAKQLPLWMKGVLLPLKLKLWWAFSTTFRKQFRDTPSKAPSEMQIATQAVTTLLSDRRQIRIELNKLVDEAALCMLENDSPLNRSALRSGRVTRQALLSAALIRLRDAGSTSVASVPLLSTDLLMLQGPFFDTAFPKNRNSSHGYDSHLIQAALSAPLLTQLLGSQALPRFFAYLFENPNLFGTIFDRTRSTDENFTNPDSFLFAEVRRILGLR